MTLGLPLATLQRRGNRAWTLPGNPTAQIDFAARRAYLNGASYFSEAEIKALFSSFMTPACYITTSAGELKAAPANSVHGFYGSDRGQLIEEARTNSLLTSQSLNNANWSMSGGLTPIDNVALAPDGTLTASSITEDTSNSTHSVNQSTAKAASAITYTDSYYVKPVNRNYVQLRSDNTSTTNVAYAQFLLTGVGTIVGTGSTGNYSGASATIVALADGWYRISLTYTTSTATSNRSRLYVDDGSTLISSGPSFASNGLTAYFVWGMQHEVGSFSTSYIPTTSAEVTRAASSLVRTLGATEQAGVNTNVTAFANWIAGTVAGTPTALYLDSGISTNSIRLLQNISNVRCTVFASSSSIQLTPVSAAVSVRSSIKLAAANQSANHAASSNLGGTQKTDATAIFPTGINRMIVGSRDGVDWVNGYVRRVAIFGSRQSNAALEALVA